MRNIVFVFEQAYNTNVFVSPGMRQTYCQFILFYGVTVAGIGTIVSCVLSLFAQLLSIDTKLTRVF